MIKSVIKSQKGMVLVFNEKGEQVPEYQGPYEQIREKVLADAPPEAVFGIVTTAIQRVRKEDW